MSKENDMTLTIHKGTTSEPHIVDYAVNCKKLIINGSVIFEKSVDVNHCEISRELFKSTLDISRQSYHYHNEFNLLGVVIFKEGFHCEDTNVV